MIKIEKKKYTYPNAEFGYVFSLHHLPKHNAQEQLQV